MRVLIATALGRGPGGVTSHIESLTQALRIWGVESSTVWPESMKVRDRVRAVLRSLGSRDRARRELTKAGVTRAWAKVQAVARDRGFDLLHVHDVLLASQVTPGLRFPMVLTVHGPLSREAVMAGIGGPSYLSYLTDVERRAYQTATAIISVDTGQKDVIVNEYGVPAEKVHVILNAVDTDLFSPSPVVEASEFTAKRQYFLVPRRLVPKNGVDVAIRAFHTLLKGDAHTERTSAYDVELDIAGDGPDRPGLADLASRLHVEDRVRFLGSVDHADMVTLMRGCIGVIIPSVPVAGVIEASSIAALEGMSVGKPVLASRIGGLGEMIEDGRTGWLFEPGDHRTLATLMERMLDEPKERIRVGVNARKHVVIAHSYRAWGSRVLKVYRDALRLETAVENRCTSA